MASAIVFSSAPWSFRDSADLLRPISAKRNVGGAISTTGPNASRSSAAALSLYLIDRPRPEDRPRRIVVVNRSLGRLERLRRMVEQERTDIQFEYIQNQDPARNDALMAALPPGSLVINATGMGKDTPGSPVTGAGLFPLDGIAWELNYRGQLDFMRQALAQKEARRLTVEDGWRYFIHGWAQVIGHVLHLEIDEAMLNHLAELAAQVRG